MSALDENALRDLALSPGPGTEVLAAGLGALGAQPTLGGGPAMLALVAVPVPRNDALGAAATGAVAAALGSVFRQAKAAQTRLADGGCLLFVLLGAGDGELPALQGGLVSLTRTLALEWAPALRVNAIVSRHAESAVQLAALAGGRAGRALTGAVLTSG